MTELEKIWNESSVTAREDMLRKLGVKDKNVVKKWARNEWADLHCMVKRELENSVKP